ncbi:MAG: hypothetical protein H0T46_20180, partial [Deltaproteobacteria bacterium]|nr:hypothetical protein [Deltaproteobacteria bacterium]
MGAPAASAITAGSAGRTRMLAPIVVAHVADGYRVALDDQPRTGARASLTTRAVAAELMIDD